MTYKKALEIQNAVISLYPNEKCTLEYSNALELLIATRLSAQCTDERVNIVTPTLFNKYHNVEEYAKADITDIEKIIHSCGFYKDKAKSIKEMSIQIINNFNGQMPNTLEGLTSLFGIGRKTANLIMGEIFKMPAYITDTHCIRLSNRLGFCKTTEPQKVEMILRKYILEENSLKFCHGLVAHGRKVCKSRSPLCAECTLSEYCVFNKSK
ncbi:MAG: endonuclease III [Clostridia bacterium]